MSKTETKAHSVGYVKLFRENSCDISHEIISRKNLIRNSCKLCAAPTTTIQVLVDDFGRIKQHADRGQEKRSGVQFNTWEDNTLIKWEAYLKDRPLKILEKLRESSIKEKSPNITSHAKRPKCFNPSNLRTNSSQEGEIDGNKGPNLTHFVKLIFKGSKVKIWGHGSSVKGKDVYGIWGGLGSIT
ncbi:hypothetical protein RND71_008254 [Anisodus tanguticus]|uniref:Uncharacterized protein n=1 Tax=Anisodus tanguticus TaxID=243964 RepID=A0AAE1SMW2_9SOLA|nr:hypothetical protein RND71_008254 [Anisodus tanguticus]